MHTTQQASSINTEVCDPGALESNLGKIISLAERKGGIVKARVGQDKSDSGSDLLGGTDILLCSL
jgi:hypothetical protein